MPTDNKKKSNILTEAVADSRILKEAALEAAQKQILESMAPSLKKLLDRTLRESVDRVNAQGSDYYAPGSREKHKTWEEGQESQLEDENNKQEGQKASTTMDEKENNMMKDDDGEKEQKDENLGNYFPGLSEEEALEALMGGVGSPMLGEDPDPDPDPYGSMAPAPSGGQPLKMGEEFDVANEGDGDNDKDDEKPMGEEVEISEAELAKFYKNYLKTEVQVKKGFSDMTKGGEEFSETGLVDKKSGEHDWDKETPPHMQKWAVYKEALERDNRKLKESLKKAMGMVRTLGESLHEVNLFNSKILHVNRILNQHGRLSTSQKRSVMETLDKARTIDEVKLVYEAVNTSLGASQSLTESSHVRKPVANAARGQTKAPLLTEGASGGQRGGNEKDPFMARLQELAGLRVLK